MRKRSENRGYTDENIRDSIVMGDVPSKFPDLGKLRTTAVVSDLFQTKRKRSQICLSGLRKL